jgi:hypothetical protein
VPNPAVPALLSAKRRLQKEPVFSDMSNHATGLDIMLIALCVSELSQTRVKVYLHFANKIANFPSG